MGPFHREFELAAKSHSRQRQNRLPAVVKHWDRKGMNAGRRLSRHLADAASF